MANPPTLAPMRKSEDFFARGGGVGGVGLREKKHELCKCVKQTATSTRFYRDAIIAFNCRPLIQ